MGSLCIDLVPDLWLPLQFHGQVPIWGQSWLLWLAPGGGLLFGHSFVLPLDTLKVFTRTNSQERRTPQSSVGAFRSDLRAVRASEVISPHPLLCRSRGWTCPWPRSGPGETGPRPSAPGCPLAFFPGTLHCIHRGSFSLLLSYVVLFLSCIGVSCFIQQMSSLKCCL